MHLDAGELVSVNIGRPRPVPYRGRQTKTSIFKEPVEGRLEIKGVNVEGDQQADLKVHGGPDKAIYSYASEDYEWWSEELGSPTGPGTFGENLTTAGIDVSGAVIGEHWRVGSALLEVAQPRTPCFKLGIRMGTQRFPRMFSLARRPGAYLRIIEEGDVGAGDRIEIVSRPEHRLTVADVATIRYDGHDRAGELLAAPELPARLHGWAREMLERFSASGSNE